jgi:hypothetical protein
MIIICLIIISDVYTETSTACFDKLYEINSHTWTVPYSSFVAIKYSSTFWIVFRQISHSLAHQKFPIICVWI